MAYYAHKTRSPGDRTRASDVSVRHSVPTPVGQAPQPIGQSQAAVGGGARALAIAQLRRTLLQSPPVRQLARISAMLQWPSQPTKGKPVQRLATVKDDPAKLSFVIDELGRHTKAVFTNSTEEQLTEFIREVNLHWRSEYSGKKLLTKDSAAAALKSHQKDLLKTLGKATPAQLDYQRLSQAITDAFADETDNLYSIATRREKVEGPPPGSVWWLDQVHSEKLITPEDKSDDDRLVSCAKDNIVKTNADKADTATALFEIDQQGSAVQDIAADNRTWELHAHVKKDGDVDFAHTKVNNQHKATVNDWFTTNVKARDRSWDDL